MSELPPPNEPGRGNQGAPAPEEHLPFWLRWSELAIVAMVIGLGILVLLETQNIRVTPMTRVSPRTIPYVIGLGLVLVGIWYLVEVIRSPYNAQGDESEDVDPEAETDWIVIAIIAVGLVLYALLMEYSGFVVASAVLFFVSAFAMGSRRYLRDVVIGLLLAIAIYLIFVNWLGVRLPAGELAGWLPDW